MEECEAFRYFGDTKLAQIEDGSNEMMKKNYCENERVF